MKTKGNENEEECLLLLKDVYPQIQTRQEG